MSDALKEINKRIDELRFKKIPQEQILIKQFEARISALEFKMMSLSDHENPVNPTDISVFLGNTKSIIRDYAEAIVEKASDLDDNQTESIRKYVDTKGLINNDRSKKCSIKRLILRAFVSSILFKNFDSPSFLPNQDSYVIPLIEMQTNKATIWSNATKRSHYELSGSDPSKRDEGYINWFNDFITRYKTTLKQNNLDEAKFITKDLYNCCSTIYKLHCTVYACYPRNELRIAVPGCIDPIKCENLGNPKDIEDIKGTVAFTIFPGIQNLNASLFIIPHAK